MSACAQKCPNREMAVRGPVCPETVQRTHISHAAKSVQSVVYVYGRRRVEEDGGRDGGSGYAGDAP